MYQYDVLPTPLFDALLLQHTSNANKNMPYLTRFDHKWDKNTSSTSRIYIKTCDSSTLLRIVQGFVPIINVSCYRSSAKSDLLQHFTCFFIFYTHFQVFSHISPNLCTHPVTTLLQSHPLPSPPPHPPPYHR